MSAQPRHDGGAAVNGFFFFFLTYKRFQAYNVQFKLSDSKENKMSVNPLPDQMGGNQTIILLVVLVCISDQCESHM